MERSLDLGQLQPACEPPTIDYATALNRAYAQVSPLPANPTPDAANEFTDGCEPSEAPPASDDELPPIEHWKPIEPQYCKAIADHYQVGKRSIQKWLVELQTLAPWLAKGELRLDDDRYTPLAVELLGDRYFAGSTKKWTQILAQRFTGRIATAAIPNANATVAPAIQPDVLPAQDAAPTDDPNQSSQTGRPALPPADRTADPSRVPTGRSFLDALHEEELDLQALEDQELQLLGRMYQSYQRLDQNQAQWDRTTDLRRQRLLRQTRLEAAALATEMEAEFEDTLRETQYRIRRGAVGKPPVETPRSQSA